MRSLQKFYSLFTGCLMLLLLLPCFIFSQTSKSTDEEQQIWLGYFNQTRFSKRWGLWADMHLRTKEDFATNFSQLVIRPGLTYYLTDDAKFTAGYAFINHFPADNHKNISQPEHRPWQQFQWHTKYPKVKLMQWFRLEERFRHKIKNDDELADGYTFNWRLRYNILSQFPLSKKRFAPGTFSFVASNEVFVNFGKQITYNYFDQNRFFAGFHYHVNKHDNLQFGYMNLFQQLAAGNRYRSLHTARIFYFHNLNFHKSH
jgi:hypothetical protein